jgi:hypothetical protein
MASRPANRLSKLISSLHKKLPSALHQPAQTLAFNSQVPLCLGAASTRRRVAACARSQGAGMKSDPKWNPQVKYAGTSGIWIEKMGNDEVVMTLKNRFRCVVCPPLRALVRAARTGPPLPPAAEARRVQRANCATPCACRVQNHIKGVHACGMALLAESATGAVFGMNLPGHDHVSKSSA